MPWIGILVFGCAAIVTLLPGQAEFLGSEFLGYMYAFGAMLSFTIAHLAVMRLRATEPEFARPYRGPGNLRVLAREEPRPRITPGRAMRASTHFRSSSCAPGVLPGPTTRAS